MSTKDFGYAKTLQNKFRFTIGDKKIKVYNIN